MVNVAFICVHNSCRSQIAEAIGHLCASDVFKSYSAGTEIKSKINKDAIRLLNEQYQINVVENQYPKLLKALPRIDIVVTMGCGVSCPYLPCRELIEWNIEDPTGKSDTEFVATIDEIKERVLLLKNYVKKNYINLK